MLDNLSKENASLTFAPPLCMMLLLGFMSMAGTAGAATITVTASAPDVLNGANGSCALREAIQNINDGATTYADCLPTGVYGTADTITLPTGTYTTLIPGFDNANAKGDMDILKSVTLNGAGAATTIIDGGGIDRIFFTFPATITVNINGVTIQNGLSIANGDGGGILMDSIMTITNSVIKNNTGGNGGGIFCRNGSLTIDNTTISGNTANGGQGGGINTSTCTALIVRNNSLINNNTATGGDGGGIRSLITTTTITNSTISNNQATAATGKGGGVSNASNRTMTITSSTISGNTAASFGGGINNSSSGILHIHSSTITNNISNFRAGGIMNNTGSTLTIDDSIGTGSTISGNTAASLGGGIWSTGTTTTIADTTISGNTATTSNGGGINSSSVSLTITNSTISGNSAPAGSGGGVYNLDGPADISNTTISGNTAKSGGGGIYNHRNFSASPLTLTNSTVSGNTLTGVGAIGGGIRTNAPLTATNSTITDNSATTGGGLWTFGGGALTLNNTIIAKSAGGGQIGGDCFLSAVVPVALNSLDSDGSCGVGTTVANALLAPLANNGGPTMTHALQLGSLAIDTGDATTCAAAPVNGVDQRGVIRPQGAGCDIGAFESLPFISLTLNAAAFNTGGTMILTGGSVASNPPINVDVYVAQQQPDGTFLFMQPGMLGPTIGVLGASLVPLIANIPLPDFNAPIFNFTFTGAEAVGAYTWFAALTQPGTLNLIGTLTMAQFTFAP